MLVINFYFIYHLLRFNFSFFLLPGYNMIINDSFFDYKIYINQKLCTKNNYLRFYNM